MHRKIPKNQCSMNFHKLNTLIWPRNRTLPGLGTPWGVAGTLQTGGHASLSDSSLLPLARDCYVETKGMYRLKKTWQRARLSPRAHVWDSAGRSAKGMERQKWSEEQEDVSIREVISAVAKHGRDHGHGITWALDSGRNLGLKLS